jgi:hypothetical protein
VTQKRLEVSGTSLEAFSAPFAQAFNESVRDALSCRRFSLVILDAKQDDAVGRVGEGAIAGQSVEIGVFAEGVAE